MVCGYMRLMEIQRAWVASSIVNSLRRGSRNYDCRTILLGSWRNKEIFYVDGYRRYQAQRTTQTGRLPGASRITCEVAVVMDVSVGVIRCLTIVDACRRVSGRQKGFNIAGYDMHVTEHAKTGRRIGKQVDWCAWRAWKPARCSGADYDTEPCIAWPGQSVSLKNLGPLLYRR